MPFGLGFFAVAGAGAAGGGSYELIESTILGSNTSSVTFSNIDTYASTYKHLQLRIVTRSSSSLNEWLYIRLNGDTASNYAYHELTGDGSGVSSSGSSSQTIIQANRLFGASNPANAFSAIVIDILDFSNTSKFKTIRQLSYGSSSSATAQFVQLISALWRSTNGITTIAFTTLQGANFLSGSRFSLYGIKG